MHTACEWTKYYTSFQGGRGSKPSALPRSRLRRYLSSPFASSMKTNPHMCLTQVVQDGQSVSRRVEVKADARVIHPTTEYVRHIEILYCTLFSHGYKQLEQKNGANAVFKFVYYQRYFSSRRLAIILENIDLDLCFLFPTKNGVSGVRHCLRNRLESFEYRIRVLHLAKRERIIFQSTCLETVPAWLHHTFLGPSDPTIRIHWRHYFSCETP